MPSREVTPDPADIYGNYQLSSYTPSPSRQRQTPSPEPRFVQPRPYPASPSPSVYSHHSSPQQQQYSYPMQHSMSAPIPQLEFIPPPPHYRHQPHVPLFASPLQHHYTRRASSTGALDFPPPPPLHVPSSGPTPGLGIEFDSAESAHLRRFSEVASGEGGFAAPAEVEDYSGGLHSPTMLSFRRPSVGGYSSFTSAHFERMDAEAGTALSGYQ